MYTILGATGHSGSAAVKTLLTKGAKVRAVGRDAAKIQQTLGNQVEAFAADIYDSASLAKAFEGTAGVYVLLPPRTKEPELLASGAKMSDAIVAALNASAVSRIVVLSSIGAQHDANTGPILALHDFEKKLATLRAGLPAGNRIEVGGPVEEGAKGQSSINAQMPIMAIVVLTLLMIQLQSFARVMMVVLTAPLGLIGVVLALLLFNKPFGFVAMLGVIAMFGIIMRNSVILVDQIEQDIAAGHPRFDAIVGATVRRFRPITLTAAAAVLALIPLLRSHFFGPMATALMGGITSATVLTLLYLPALDAGSVKDPAHERAGFEEHNTPDARNGGQS